MTPFFSIIIPTYNRVKIIKASLDSVVLQNFTDWELIVVDDGSTDNTKQLVNAIIDDRIQYLWKENGERGSARNFGVKQAKGQYVFFLDSDDLVYPNHLQHAFDELTRLNFPVFFHSRYEEVYPNKKIQAEPLNQNKIWETVQRQNKFACQFFLKREIALAIPFSENRALKIGEDWLVILKVGLKYPLYISNEIHSAIVQHPDRSMKMASSQEILASRDLIITELGLPNSTIPKFVFLELTSLAALSASILCKRKETIKLLFSVIIKSPVYIFRKKRTLAILKHFIFGKN